MNALIEGHDRSNPLTTHDNAGIASWGVKVLWDATFDDLDSALGLHDQIMEAVHDGKLGQSRLRWKTPGDLDSSVDVRITKASKGNIYLRVIHDQAGVLYVAVVLYDTEIVRYYPEGTFSVDNGGFNTPTTSSRVTQFTPDGWSVYHSNKQLSLRGRGATIYPATHKVKVDPTTGFLRP